MIVNADCIEHMRTMPENSIDAIVTDPPYGLGFMGKKWDALPPGVEWAEACLRVLKPGGHLLAFGGSRTYHRLACAVEDAGFEIRDQIMWLYGSGFPKSHNLKGEWSGWGTALKPAHEPIVVARKPLVGTVAQNVLEFGTGAVNVDGCRVGTGEDKTDGGCAGTSALHDGGITSRAGVDKTVGRWPANVVLDEQAAALLDEQTGGKGGASRFFYVAKASSRERNAGLDGFEEKAARVALGPATQKECVVCGHRFIGSDGFPTCGHGEFRYVGQVNAPRKNVHPTVKPIALMRYLCRLVTPPGGTILDPFTGSGTTGCAAVLEGFDFIGIEREPEYARIAEARIAHWTPDQLELAA